MKTIQLELNDDLYSNITDNNIDIQAKFKEFLFNITDDGYQSIPNNQAKLRVKNAVDDYKENGLKNFFIKNETKNHYNGCKLGD